MKLSRPLAALSAVLLTTAGLAACSTDTEGSAEVRIGVHGEHNQNADAPDAVKTAHETKLWRY